MFFEWLYYFLNRMEIKEKRKVMFDFDVEQIYFFDGKWSFLRYFVLIFKGWVVMVFMIFFIFFIRRVVIKRSWDKVEY